MGNAASGADLLERCRQAVDNDNGAKLQDLIQGCTDEERGRALSGATPFNEVGDSILSYAVARHSQSCVRLLLAAGADVSAASSRTGRNALHVACLPPVRVEKKRVRSSRTMGRIRLSMKASALSSPGGAAGSAGEAGGAGGAGGAGAGGGGLDGDATCLNLLLRQLVVKFRERHRGVKDAGRTPATVLQCLLDQDGDGHSLLHLAILHKRLAHVSSLLRLEILAKEEADGEATEEEQEALVACLRGLLLKLSILPNYAGLPPTHLLVEAHAGDQDADSEWTRLLRSFAEASPESLFATDPQGRTALFLSAVICSGTHVFKQLLALGSPVLATNLEGRTVLHEICSANCYRRAKYVLQSRTAGVTDEDRACLASCRDGQQRNSLHYLFLACGAKSDAACPDIRLVKLLLRHCPSLPLYQDSEGRTALSIVRGLLQDGNLAESHVQRYKDIKSLLKRSKDAPAPPEGNPKAQAMSLQLGSDLHIEFGYDYSKVVEPSAPYLALLGDIGLAKDETYREFLLEQADRFEVVFVIAGNHEYYKTDVAAAQAAIAATCAERDNMHFLNRHSVLLEGLRVVGCTLWSSIPEKHRETVGGHMSDYRRINVAETDEEGKREERKLTVADTMAMHQADAEFLEEEIGKAEAAGEQVVVLTHHSPVLYKGCGNAKQWLRPQVHGFGTDLTRLMRPNVLLWAYGHTHWHHDIAIRSTRVVSNPRGYEMEEVRHKSFSSRFCVRLPIPSE